MVSTEKMSNKGKNISRCKRGKREKKERMEELKTQVFNTSGFLVCNRHGGLAKAAKLFKHHL